MSQIIEHYYSVSYIIQLPRNMIDIESFIYNNNEFNHDVMLYKPQHLYKILLRWIYAWIYSDDFQMNLFKFRLLDSFVEILRDVEIFEIKDINSLQV